MLPVKREKIQYYLDRLLRLKIDETNSMIHHPWTSLFIYEIAREIDSTPLAVRTAISHSNGTLNIDDLISKCQNLPKISSAKYASFSIYFPLTVKFIQLLPFKFSLSGKEYVVLDLMHATEEELALLTNSTDQYYSPPHLKLKFSEQVLKINVWAADHEHATTEAVKELNYLRHIYEFLCVSPGGVWIAEAPAMLARFQHPSWGVSIHNKDRSSEFHWYLKKDLQVPGTEINDECMTVIQEASEFLSTTNTYAQYLKDIITLYGDAKESEYEHNALLAYWQCLERMTFAQGKGGTTEHVWKRVEGILETFGLPFPFTHFLKDLAVARNEYVHSGRYAGEINLEDLSLLCRECIRFFYLARTRFRTEEDVRIFFANCTKSKEEIEQIQYVQSKILEIKALTQRKSPDASREGQLPSQSDS